MLVLTRYIHVYVAVLVHVCFGVGCAAMYVCTERVAECLSCGKRAITAVGEL